MSFRPYNAHPLMRVSNASNDPYGIFGTLGLGGMFPMYYGPPVNYSGIDPMFFLATDPDLQIVPWYPVSYYTRARAYQATPMPMPMPPSSVSLGANPNPDPVASLLRPEEYEAMDWAPSLYARAFYSSMMSTRLRKVKLPRNGSGSGFATPPPPPHPAAPAPASVPPTAPAMCNGKSCNEFHLPADCNLLEQCKGPCRWDCLTFTKYAQQCPNVPLPSLIECIQQLQLAQQGAQQGVQNIAKGTTDAIKSTQDALNSTGKAFTDLGNTMSKIFGPCIIGGHQIPIPCFVLVIIVILGLGVLIRKPW